MSIRQSARLSKSETPTATTSTPAAIPAAYRNQRRVGYFTTVHKDFEKVNGEDFMVQYANHWRLEKKDPNAALSEPAGDP